MSFLPKIIAMQICACNTILCVCFLGWGNPSGEVLHIIPSRPHRKNLMNGFLW